MYVCLLPYCCRISVNMKKSGSLKIFYEKSLKSNPKIIWITTIKLRRFSVFYSAAQIKYYSAWFQYFEASFGSQYLLDPPQHGVNPVLKELLLRLQVHSILISVISLGTELMSLYFSILNMWLQKFSNGFGSKLFPDQLVTWNGCSARMFLIFFEVWNGAASYKKWVLLWMPMKGMRWFSSTSWYFSLFIVQFFGRK